MREAAGCDRPMSTHRVALPPDGGHEKAELERRHGGESASACSTPPRPECTPGDGELLTVLAADSSALARLYDRYAKLVYGLALVILQSREEAEDLTQEVFLSLCEPTAYDPGRGSVGAFLTTVTRSRAIDRLRRRGRSARLLKTWHEARPPPAPQQTTFDCLATWRSAERVRAGLAELPEPHRQVLELAYYRGLSQGEIAADLDTPLGTVKSRTRRALMSLARAVEGLTA